MALKPMKKAKPIEKKQKSPEELKLDKAEAAVSKYEVMKHDLLTLREKFAEEFPEAQSQVETMKQLEDEIEEQITICKELVRQGGRTVGDFLFQAKFTQPGYDGMRLLELVAKLPPKDAGALIIDLYERGFFKAVQVDTKSAQVVRGSDMELRERLEEAWDKGGSPLTPAITTPKVP